jgi:hypothetical protein
MLSRPVLLWRQMYIDYVELINERGIFGHGNLNDFMRPGIR